MNDEGRQIAIKESLFRCAITWKQYDKRTYFEIEKSLHPFMRLTVDHWDGRRRVKGRKVDEESDNIVIVIGKAHDMKDNANRDAQITWLKQEVGAAEMFGEKKQVAHMREVLLFLEANPTHDLKAYLGKFVEERGPFSAAYDRAKEREYAEEPKRREKKAKARHDVYEKAKKRAGGTPLSKRKKPKAKAGGTKYASSRWAVFDALPVSNGNPSPPSP